MEKQNHCAMDALFVIIAIFTSLLYIEGARQLALTFMVGCSNTFFSSFRFFLSSFFFSSSFADLLYKIMITATWYQGGDCDLGFILHFFFFLSLSSYLIAEKERPICADHKLEEALILRFLY